MGLSEEVCGQMWVKVEVRDGIMHIKLRCCWHERQRLYLIACKSLSYFYREYEVVGSAGG